MDQAAHAPSAPFLVRGRIGDTPVERAVATIEEAEELAQLAATAGDGSWGSWMVLPTDPDSPAEPIVLFGRFRKGITGESRREVHAVGVVPGLLLAERLRAACGARLARGDLEFVELGHHMPCERCLQRLGLVPEHIELPPAAAPTPPAPAGLPDLHPDLRELFAQLGHDRPALPGRGCIEPPVTRHER
ncbi:hypothetical protein GCM10027258_81420 [Amycolatopsis stemonae]